MVLQYFLYQEYAAWLASRETSIAMCRAGDVMLFWGGAWFGAIWRAENQIMAVTGGESWSWSLNMYIIYYTYIIIYMCIIQCCVSWLITVSLDIYRYLYLSNYVWYYDMIFMSLVVSPTRDLRVPYFHLCHLSGNPHFGSNGMGAGPCVALFHGFELRQNE